MKRIAVVFSGQGSQYLGMGKELYMKYDIVKEIFEEAQDCVGYDLKTLLFKGSISSLCRIEKFSVAITVVGYAAFRVYMSEVGIEPILLAGHSVGEIGALAASEAISFKDALQIAKFRGELAQKVYDEHGGSMGIVDNLTIDQVSEVCKKFEDVDIACYNASNQIALSGREDSLSKVFEELCQIGGLVTPLLTSPPLHSKKMQPMCEIFQKYLNNISFQPCRWPVISNVFAKEYGQDTGTYADNLSLQLIEPVRWTDIVDVIAKNQITDIVEMSAMSVLGKLIKNKYSYLNVFKLGSEEDILCIREHLMKEEHVRKNVIIQCLKICTCSENHYFESDEIYEREVLNPWNELEQLQSKIEKEGKILAEDEIKMALMQLLRILNGKRTPLNEKEDWINSLFAESSLPIDYFEYIINLEKNVGCGQNEEKID